jgi:hypothetical protein
VNILRLLKRQHKKAAKDFASAQMELQTIEDAIKLLSRRRSIGGKVTGHKRRRMSAQTRAKMRASAKKRWAAKKATT